jgi:hypothetical protein
MAVTTATTISLSDVKAEVQLMYGPHTTVSLGGSNVRKLANQVDGALSLSSLRGSEWCGLSGLPASIEGSFTGSGTTYAGFYIYADGTHKKREHHTYTTLSPSWKPNEELTGSEFEIKVSVTNGSATSGAARDTWLSLGTNRYWQVSMYTSSSTATATSTLNIQIRSAQTQTVLASDTITLIATKYGSGGNPML